MKTHIWGIVGALIIGFLAGVGAFQMAVAADVRAHTVKIERLEKDYESERNRTDTRIFEVVGLVKEIINDNRELKAIMRAQLEQHNNTSQR